MSGQLPDPRLRKEKVAIITGASQGIGAGLTKAYREREYAVIATAQSIGPSEDPGTDHRAVVAERWNLFKQRRSP
jgi:NAD(P)-dependent dehydrogenase (short-subunit alcohol dehydrogenase family)